MHLFKKAKPLVVASIYLISVQVLLMKTVQRPRYLSRTLIFVFGKQKPGRGTILLEILGICFNKKKHHQQNQFPSSFPSSSND